MAFRFEIRRDWFEKHHAGVARVPQVACRRVRDKHRLVVAGEIVAVENFVSMEPTTVNLTPSMRTVSPMAGVR